ncbi:ATP-binding protein [Bradyrhizobium sp. 62]|uniref:PAS domain-containing sensor histidine kinase n=1 Tax=Bradyrhizobium sp. 62 TaxID=1043588 RepID=UPI001FF8817F|nr:ATP-binding protein [Bradyrhizobium sp. 62]MCK1367319.1 PAS domain S-box protein [Bradyrhizobium sp. 62]
MPWVEELADSGELRRCIRDLAALSTLPALWERYSAKEIADSVALALQSILSADFVHVSLSVGQDEAPITATHGPRGPMPREVTEAIRLEITPEWFKGAGRPQVIPNPLGRGSANIATAAVGLGRSILVAGSSGPGFPRETDRLMLGVAASDVAIALQRKQVEADERRFVALVERSPDFVAFSDLNGRLQFVNLAGRQLVGIEPTDDVSNLHVVDFVSSSDEERLLNQCWPVALTDRRWMGELSLCNFKAGEKIPFLVDIFRIDDPRGHGPMNVAMVGRDLRRQKQAEGELRRLNESLERSVELRTAELMAEITERKRADERSRELQSALSHAGRLSVAGEMAAALAHELNQPLTAVANSANAALRLLARSGSVRTESMREILDDVAGQALRAGQILRRLRDFITRGESEKKIEDIETLIREASAFARTGFESLQVSISLFFDPRVSHIYANRIQIQQVLVNLIRNALEEVASVPQAKIDVVTRQIGNEEIEISVADNGRGVVLHVIDTLFQPFISTRHDGMGLGLAICRSIVESHSGKLWYEPNPNGGAMFRFTLSSAEPTE